MGLYNFKAQFKAPIQNGTKLHTIRAPRKDGREDKRGSWMHLYTGLRTRQAELILLPIPVCLRVESIMIREMIVIRETGLMREEIKRVEIWLGPFCEKIRQSRFQQNLVLFYPDQFGLDRLDPQECENLARADGFEGLAEMLTFWTGRLPFYGHVFHWKGVTT